MQLTRQNRKTRNQSFITNLKTLRETYGNIKAFSKANSKRTTLHFLREKQLK
jgi:hypothetical protein